MKQNKTSKIRAFILLCLMSMVIVGTVGVIAEVINNVVTSDKEKVMVLRYTISGIEEIGDQSVVLLDNGRSFHISDEAVESLTIGDTCKLLYTTSHWFDKKYIVAAFCEGQ